MGLQLADQRRELRRGQFGVLFRRRVGRHAPQGLLEVALRVDLLRTAVCDERVEQSAVRSRLGIADEEVVLQPELGRTDEVLNSVVVDVEARFVQELLEPSPLTEGVVAC